MRCMRPRARYGFDRDELYFLDGARHLQASYVDQPVLAPLFAWVSLKLFGVSLPGLRVWPALAAGATVVVGGAVFAIALVIGALLSGGRRMIWNRWFLAAPRSPVAFEVPTCGGRPSTSGRRSA